MELFGDFDTSVQKALSEIDPKWPNYQGLIVCGSHNPHNVELIIDKIKEYREAKSPFLGICFGHQLAAIEYARNVLGIEDATSEELGIPGTFVVKKRSELKVGLHDGESYWNNYEVSQDILDLWVKADNFMTAQFHPEYQSSKDNPHPLLVNFLNHAMAK